MAKQKFYVVWQGQQPGIYDSWTECQLQIKGYPGARYKAFKSREEAEAAFRDSPDDYVERKGAAKKKTASELKEVIWDSLSVDAACSGNPGDMEYRGVNTKNGDEIFRIGPFRQGTNNVGEFLALVHALAYLKQIGHSSMPIYSDSRTAMSWVRRKQVKTNLKKSRHNEKLFKLIRRALNWLADNEYSNPILKWNTAQWGEIPADFGRK